MKRIAVIGCGAKKRPCRVRARYLYTGPLFTDALAHALAHGFNPIVVLSAKHGIVDLEQEIDPYDLRLADLTRAEQIALGERARASLRTLAGGGPADLTIFAGRPYYYLVGPLADEGWTLHDPLDRLRTGERRRWFAEFRAVAS